MGTLAIDAGALGIAAGALTGAAGALLAEANPDAAINPVGSVKFTGLFFTYATGLFFTYAYRFRSSFVPIGSVCKNLPSVGEYIRAL